jgi:hypothetical protein
MDVAILTMDVKKGGTTDLLLTCYVLEQHYLCRFTKIDDRSLVVYCITENDASDDGPMLLSIEETTSPNPLLGQVELREGQWDLAIYEQASTTNLDPQGLRMIWSEEVNVTTW